MIISVLLLNKTQTSHSQQKQVIISILEYISNGIHVHSTWNQVLHLAQATKSLLNLVSQTGQTVVLRAGDKKPSSTLSSCSGDSLVPTLVPHP